MSWFDFNDIPDWVLKNECQPFEDSLGNLCITVKSKYESFGGERDARLDEESCGEAIVHKAGDSTRDEGSASVT